MHANRMILWLRNQNILIFIACLFVFGCFEKRAVQNEPLIRNGAVDLTQHDFDRSGPLELNGIWDFYPDAFVMPADTDSYEEIRKMKVPGSWTKPGDSIEAYPAEMKATYRLLVTLPEDRQDFMLEVPTAGTAYRLFWNGKQLATEGNIENPADSDHRAPVKRLLGLSNSPSGVNELLIHVSNEAHTNAGIWWPLQIAPETILEKSYRQDLLLVALLFGALFIIGIYHIGYYITSRIDPSTIFFGLFSITIGLWLLQSGEKLISANFPSITWDTATRLEYGAFYFGNIVFPLFLSTLFRQERMPLFRNAILAVAAILFSTTFFLPFSYYLRTLPPAQLTAGVVIIYSTILLIRAALAKKTGARSMILSFSVLAFTVAHDIFFAAYAFESVYIAPYGFLIFIVGQSLVLANYNSSAFKRLDELKENLERTVQKRTATLNSLNELTKTVNSTRDINSIVSHTADYMIHELGMKRMFLMLVDNERNEVVAHGGVISKESTNETKFFESLRAPINPDLGTNYRTIQKKKTLQMDLSKIPEVTAELDRKVIEYYNPDFIIEIPVLLEDQILGVVVIDSISRLDKEKLRELESVVSQIAGPVQNARLLKTVENQKEESEILSGLARETNRGAVIEELLEPVGHTLNSRLGKINLALYTPNQNETRLELKAGFNHGELDSPENYPDFVQSISTDPVQGGIHARIYQRKKTFHSPRINQRALENSGIDKKLYETWKYEWFIIIPLVVKNNCTGLLSVSGKSTDSVPKDNIPFIEKCADLVAGALQNFQLIDEIKEEQKQTEKEKEIASALEKETRALAEFTRLVNEKQSLESIVEEVAQSVVESMDLRAAFITVVNEKEKEFQNIGGYGKDFNEAQMTFAKGARSALNPEAGIYYRTYQRKKSVYLRRMPHEMSDTDRLLADILELKSFAYVPMLLQGDVIGILGIDPGYRKLSNDDMQKMARYADQVAGAINNAALLKQVEQQQEIIQGQAHITRLAAATDNLDEIIDEIFKYVYEHYSIASGIVMLPDRQKKELKSNRVVTFEDKDKLNLWDADEYAKNLKIPLNENGGTLARTFQRTKPFYVPDASRLSEISRNYPGAEKDREIFKNLNYKSYFSLPMHVNQQPVALLNFTSYKDEFKLTRNEREELTTLATQLAGIIRSRQLADNLASEKALVEQEKKDSQLLADLARKSNESKTINETLRNLRDLTSEECRVNRISLWLVDRSGNHLICHENHFDEEGMKSTDNAPDTVKKIPLRFESGSLNAIYERKRKMYLPSIKQSFIDASPVDADIIEYFKFEWFINFPILVEGEVIGIIAFGGKNDRPGLRARSLMERMVSQTAGAIQSKMLLTQVEQEKNTARRLQQETEGLNNLLKKVAPLTDLDEIMSHVVDFTKTTYEIEYYSLYSVNHAEQQLEYLSINIPDFIQEEDADHIRNTPIPLDQGKGGFAVAIKRSPKHTYFRKLQRSFLVDIEAFIADAYNMSNMVSYPLLDGENTIAFLNFLTFDQSGLNSEQLNQLSILSDQISGIIKMNGLMRDIENQKEKAEAARAETEILADLARQANETVNLKNLCNTLFDHLEKHYEIEKQALFVVDTDSYTLEPVDGRGTDDPAVLQNWLNTFRINLEKDSGTLASTYKRQKSFYLKKIPDYLAGKDLEIVNTLNPDSILQVPLVVQDQTVAIMIADSKKILNRSDLASIERLCNQIAGAVRVVTLLQSTQDAREEAVAAKEEAEAAREESDNLLDNVLPTAVARELKEKGQVEPIYYDSVSVLFTDFVGFTTAAAKMSPAELIQELDGCFSQFDEVSRRNNLEKLKTIGDAYMAAGGLPLPSNNHAIDTVLAALEFRSFMNQMAEVKEQLGFDFWQIRIGIHTGPVTAGVIGKNKFAYDIWGDTVNTASRMESSGKPGMVNISGDTYELVKDLFECEHRGKVQAKGKGEMDMYFVHRIKPELSADDEGLLPNAMFEMARTDISVTSNNRVDSSGKKPGSDSKPAGAVKLSEIDNMRQGW